MRCGLCRFLIIKPLTALHHAVWCGVLLLAVQWLCHFTGDFGVTFTIWCNFYGLCSLMNTLPVILCNLINTLLTNIKKSCFIIQSQLWPSSPNKKTKVSYGPCSSVNSEVT